MYVQENIYIGESTVSIELSKEEARELLALLKSAPEGSYLHRELSELVADIPGVVA